MEDAFIAIVFLLVVAVLLALCCFKWFKTRNFNAKVEDIQSPPPAFVGSLSPNKALCDLVKLCENQIDGPESLLVEGGYKHGQYLSSLFISDTIYTGTNDAKIVKIVNGQIEKWLHLVETKAKPGTYSSEPKTGRPLGIRRLNSDCLVVADAYLGVFKVDFQKAIVTRLYNSQTKVDGRESCFLNDIEGFGRAQSGHL
ncbi:Adipocyte plasma membrane-associated protein [Aphelenchoides bicaudatus]|nr:Adipocyte plasma membrane-associated protein [Aphelenchoides bicaudatus]